MVARELYYFLPHKECISEAVPALVPVGLPSFTSEFFSPIRVYHLVYRYHFGSGCPLGALTSEPVVRWEGCRAMRT